MASLSPLNLEAKLFLLRSRAKPQKASFSGNGVEVNSHSPPPLSLCLVFCFQMVDGGADEDEYVVEESLNQ